MGYLRPESFEFVNMWLKYCLVYKVKGLLEKAFSGDKDQLFA